jgi:predicted ABC-type ATPase
VITVLAGVNGAGKSSIAGAKIRADGGDYFNPDEVTRSLMLNDSSMSLDEANSEAWKIGFEQLMKAIDNDEPYTFETTLGGSSIATQLYRAIELGRKVRIFYCGLSSPELHIERVAARVARGGHDIPAEMIHARWKNSTVNLVGLISSCHAIVVFDNSSPADENGPNLVCLFSLIDGKFHSDPIKDMPEWGKPLAGAALKRVLG